MAEEDKIDLLIEDARHEEITALFEQLIAATKTGAAREEAIAKLLDQKSQLFAVLLDKWKEIAAIKIPAPNVTVQSNQDAVIKAVQDSADRLAQNDEKIIGLLEQLIVIRGADVDLIVKRDYGIIEKVTAKVIMPKQKFSA